MQRRVCLIVLDSVGIGAMPDAARYGDEGAHTLGNIRARLGRAGGPGGLKLPHLSKLGLGNITNARLPGVKKPAGAYGRMAEATAAKDTVSGHWELAGLVMAEPFRVFPRFPKGLLREWLTSCGRAPAWLGNYAASGTAILDELGATHIKTGAPIVYTSADSVFQVAAHEDVIPLDELYRLCAAARALLTGAYNTGRVIARPFTGRPGHFVRTENRRDYALPPPAPTILDGLTAKGKSVLGIGKIEDIFCGRGITRRDHTTNNADGIQATLDALRTGGDDFIFTNLVDFDMLYGHRNDPEGYARALAYFDAQLPALMDALRPGDTLFITADHGCDPTMTASTDHSREYVPLLVYGAGVRPMDLGTRATFADAGATAYQLLTGETWPVGASFASVLDPGGSL